MQARYAPLSAKIEAPKGLSRREQCIRFPDNCIAPCKLVTPSYRYRLHPVERSGKLPGDRVGGIGIFAQIGGGEHSLGKIAATPGAP